MGCFGYICKHCNTPIIGDSKNGGEKCVLIHVRNGKEIGRTEGHYNEFGSVIEDKTFRNDDEKNKNSHKEILKSELNMKNSYLNLYYIKFYKNKNYSFSDYLKERVITEIRKHHYKIQNILYADEIPENCINEYNILYNKYLELTALKKTDNTKEELDSLNFHIDLLKKGMEAKILNEFVFQMFKTKYYEDFSKLPTAKLKNYSGIVAYHSKCYHKAIKEKTFNLIPSESDPDQSWGKVRKKYI